MNILRTQNLYMQACRKSSDVHELTSDELKRLQSHLLKMYKELESLCVKHNLTVMLAYGSVLGAVRHGGFIPWDDDLDVFMPRKDYELLINRYKNFSYARWISPGDLLYSIEPVANNTKLCT